jgi:hypothetical protein
MTGRRETLTIPQNGILKGRFIKSKSARELAGRIKYLISYQIVSNPVLQSSNVLDFFCSVQWTTMMRHHVMLLLEQQQL